MQPYHRDKRWLLVCVTSKQAEAIPRTRVSDLVLRVEVWNVNFTVCRTKAKLYQTLLGRTTDGARLWEGS